MSMTTTINEDAVRTRAYLLWEADGRPFGRDGHYWGLALAEAAVTPKPAKTKSAPAASAVPEKKAKPAPKAKAAPAKAKIKKK